MKESSGRIEVVVSTTAPTGTTNLTKRVEPMPHRIFEIDEILRDIVWHTRDTSEVATVSLACCCKAFEEPTLSLLWVDKSFHDLLPLLPSILTPTAEPAARPTEEEWRRLRRYAFWIRVLFVDVRPASVGLTGQESTLINLITLSSTDGSTQQATMFPNLRDLTWVGEPSSLIHLPSFVSPILTDLLVRIVARWRTEYFPGEYAPLELVINSTISPSNLRSLSIYTPREAKPSPELKRSVADLVLQCGSALMGFEVEFELPESVVLHLMSLPNLKRWEAAQLAPMELLSSPLRPALSFARMEYLSLRTATPHGWLSFINTLVGDKSHLPLVLHTPAFSFGNLASFNMNMPNGQGCISSCTFLLTDSDISLLADALPRLESVRFGQPCRFNTCKTTFRSLHTLSTRCPLLKYLCTHINTTTLIQDIRSVFEEDSEWTGSQEAGLGPSVGRRNCPLEFRNAQYLPLEENVDIGDLEMVAKGLFDISVTLSIIGDIWDLNSKLWAKVSECIKALHV